MKRSKEAFGMHSNCTKLPGILIVLCTAAHAAVPDKTITHAIESQLMFDPSVSAHAIDIVTHKGSDEYMFQR